MSNYKDEAFLISEFLRKNESFFSCDELKERTGLNHAAFIFAINECEEVNKIVNKNEALYYHKKHAALLEPIIEEEKNRPDPQIETKPEPKKEPKPKAVKEVRPKNHVIKGEEVISLLKDRKKRMTPTEISDALFISKDVWRRAKLYALEKGKVKAVRIGNSWTYHHIDYDKQLQVEIKEATRKRDEEREYNRKNWYRDNVAKNGPRKRKKPNKAKPKEPTLMNLVMTRDISVKVKRQRVSGTQTWWAAV